MKRIISLILCLAVVVSACMLSSCKEVTMEDLIETMGNPETTSSNLPMEITIYGITDESTTEQAIEKVEEALNTISVRKYNTTINLILYPEEVYAAQMFAKIKMAVNSYNTKLLGSTPAEKYEEIEFIKQSNVNYIEHVGLKEASNLPSDLVSAPLDIFLVYTPEADSPVFDPESEYYSPILKDGGMFSVLHSERALLGLNSYIKSGTYSALKTIGYTQAVNAVTAPQYKNTDLTDIFAIPNNYLYGGYDFLLVNHEILDQVYSGEDKSYLATSEDARKAAMQELDGRQEELGFTYLEKTFSSYDEYQDFSETNETFLFGYMSGELSIKNLFENNPRYDVYTIEKKVPSNANYCESMFCISPATQDIERSLDILLLLQTNEEFRNIFQYGVEGTHFEVGHDGNVTLTGGTSAESKYLMNPKWCGNMFILTPSDGMSREMQMMAANDWKLAREQVKDILG